MEIQTFFLAGNIKYNDRSRHYDITQAPAHSFAPEDARFPFPCEISWMLVLRRESRTGQQPFTFRLQLIDNAGHPIKNNSANAVGNFVDGQKFMVRQGVAAFTFPSPGDYRIDIFADETTNCSVYSYAIEITSEGCNTPL